MITKQSYDILALEMANLQRQRKLLQEKLDSFTPDVERLTIIGKEIWLNKDNHEVCARLLAKRKALSASIDARLKSAPRDRRRLIEISLKIDAIGRDINTYEYFAKK